MLDWIIKYWVQWLFGLLIAGLGLLYRHLAGQVKRERAEHEAIRDGMRSLLRRQITMDCENAFRDGWCSVNTRTSIEDMYNAYHALGGNGVVTGLRNQMLQLPTERHERPET